MTKEYTVKGQLNRTYVPYIIITALFTVGIAAGAVYCMLNTGDERQLYDYLGRFVAEFPNEINKMNVFRNAALGNIKLFILLCVCAFFKIGIAASGIAVTAKGFSIGFTSAALIKYYGYNGIFLVGANSASAVILIPSMIFFAVCSIKFALADKKNEKFSVAEFMLIALLILTIFCISALAEGYLNTILMNLVIQKIL